MNISNGTTSQMNIRDQCWYLCFTCCILLIRQGMTSLTLLLDHKLSGDIQALPGKNVSGLRCTMQMLGTWEVRQHACSHMQIIRKCIGDVGTMFVGWIWFIVGLEIWFIIAMNLSKLRELVMDRDAWRAALHGVRKRWTQLSNWTELKAHSFQGFTEYMQSIS